MVKCSAQEFYRQVKERALAGDNIDQFSQYMIDKDFETPSSSKDKIVYWRGQYNALRKALLKQLEDARKSGNAKAIDNANTVCNLIRLADKPKGKSGGSGVNKAKAFADMFAADIAELGKEQQQEDAASLATPTELNPADVNKLQELVAA